MYFGGEREEEDATEEAEVALSQAAIEGFLEEGQQLISDDRGVRLAREEEGDD